MRSVFLASCLVLMSLPVAESASARTRSGHEHVRGLARAHDHARAREAHARRLHVIRHAARHAAHHRRYARVRTRVPLEASLAGEWQAGYAALARVPERYNGNLDGMIARHAQMNGVPEALVRRVVLRESGGNPRAVGHGGAMGLMQIKTATARAMGYSGPPSGLLDAETNLTYAVRYLAGAWRVAGGNPNRAVSNYARGYYAAAKAHGFSPYADASPPYGRQSSSKRTDWSTASAMY